MEDNKLLTIVIVGRNDNHMGNFKYRLAMCINYTARNLKRIGCLDRVEILVTDWNSEIPLSQVLRLTEDAARIARFVYVPPEIASQRMPSGRVMNIVGAMNVSLRRGSGRFLMPIPADTLMPENSLRQLLLLLDGKTPVPFDPRMCLMIRQVKEIPHDVVAREPSMEEWDRYLLLNASEIRHIHQEWPGLGLGAVVVMSHDLWRRCRGYDETLGDWGWNEAELALRICQRYPWIELFSFGFVTYDMGSAEKTHADSAESEPRRQNPRKTHLSFDVNDSNWGLADHSLQLQEAECVCSEARMRGLAVAVSESGRCVTDAPQPSDLTSAEVVAHIRRTLGGKWIPPSEWPVLCVLSWYSTKKTLRRFLEYGFCDGYASAVVAAANPSVEVYGINSWNNAQNEEVDSPLWPTSLLRSVGYTGYLRLITGNPNTALARLKESFIGEMLFDVVVFRIDSVDSPNRQEQIHLISQYISKNGIVILTASSRDSLDACWKEFRLQSEPTVSIRSSNGTSAFLFRVRTERKGSGTMSPISTSDIVDFGRPSKLDRCIPVHLWWYFRRLFRL